MTRALSLAAVFVAAISLAAYAADTVDNAAAQATEGPALQNLFTSDQARQHLMHLGYTNVSELQKDADGKWVGTATKDGRTVAVAVDIKGKATN